MYLCKNSIITGTVSYLIAWLVSYWGNLLFTFKVVNKNHRVRIIKDIVRNIIVYLFMQSTMYILFDILHINFAITSFISALVSPLVSYPIMKYWVFKK